MKNILVAIDFPSPASGSSAAPGTEAAVSAAQRLAKALSGRVWLIHAARPDPEFVGYEPGPVVERHHRALELRREHRQLQDLAAELRSRGIDTTALLVEGSAVEKILEEADRLAADLIILGGRHHGVLYRTIIGSVQEGIIRHTKRPVLIVPPEVSPPPEVPPKVSPEKST